MESGEAKNPNLEDMMRLGVKAARAGNRDNARVIFRQVLDADKRNVNAWLWLAELADDNMKRRAYLETALKIDPNNATAKKKLATLDQAVARVENASVRAGIRIVAFLVAAVIIVAVVIFFVLKIMH